MITRIEIDGFKTFKDFSLDFRPFAAIVGPNASGKSNLFDAIKFLSFLAQSEIISAMQNLRGEPDELFRRGPEGLSQRMRFALEVLLPRSGSDAFGTEFDVTSQRIRYELGIFIKTRDGGFPDGIYVDHEDCRVIKGADDHAEFGQRIRVARSHRKTAFIETVRNEDGSPKAFWIRQDGTSERGATRRGLPLQLSANEATRSALSTVSTADFRHLYALKSMLSTINFLEINPPAARRPSDRYEKKSLRPDASNLSAALHEIDRSMIKDGGELYGLKSLSADLAHLIPVVRRVISIADDASKEYSFEVETADGNRFSSRVISDGTLRLLALLAVLSRKATGGILCFEEPENGVHEGRISALVELLRQATRAELPSGDFFQILMNTHSPAVLKALELDEVTLAELVIVTRKDIQRSERRTRMRKYSPSRDLFDPGTQLSKSEVEKILRGSRGDV